MKKKYDRVYQFKITLKGTKPPIWRRIQVPETYSFWDLHVAIQDAMGWLDYHLHQFDIINPATGMMAEIGIPDDDFGRDILPDWKQKIASYFSMENPSSDYVYDFGDNWKHKIKLEKILPHDAKTYYPVCITGRRACPPEDCGGVWGYENFLRIISDPDNDEYEQMMEWAGSAFDPAHFDANEVRFDDPAERRRNAFM